MKFAGRVSDWHIFLPQQKCVPKANLPKAEHRAQLASTERSIYALLYEVVQHVLFLFSI
jgi:hypothetical protein